MTYCSRVLSLTWKSCVCDKKGLWYVMQSEKYFNKKLFASSRSALANINIDNIVKSDEKYNLLRRSFSVDLFLWSLSSENWSILSLYH